MKKNSFKEERKIFSLGLGSNSVTVYKQMVRALNLASCLYEAKIKPINIAVVGGGIAGATVARALSVLKLKGISLFEQASDHQSHFRNRGRWAGRLGQMQHKRVPPGLASYYPSRYSSSLLSINLKNSERKKGC